MKSQLMPENIEASERINIPNTAVFLFPIFAARIPAGI